MVEVGEASTGLVCPFRASDRSNAHDHRTAKWSGGKWLRPLGRAAVGVDARLCLSRGGRSKEHKSNASHSYNQSN
ncbi:MAG: hypothetical protein DME64_16930 [Verrucomicrobia bacterium]|nr:MAG: hypothetical protein DME64_16930 [Verrucomicrobiota bacterium]